MNLKERYFHFYQITYRGKCMEYKEFIDGINDPKMIKQIDFYIQGYNHYRKCSIGRYIE